MPGVEPLLAHAVPFILVATRIVGLFVFAPMLTSVTIPRQGKALLAVMLAAAVYPAIPVQFADARLDLLGLAPLLLCETLIGVCIGMIASVPVMMLQMGGHVTGFQMGLSMASIYNPEFDTQSDVVGEVLFYLGFSIFLAAGGLEAMYAALLGTFERVPLGAMAVSDVPLETFIGLASAGFEMALRVAAPATAMVFLVMVAMGFVMKTMPQINVMSVGFAIKIVVGLLATAMAMQVIANAGSEETTRVLEVMGEWIRGLGARGYEVGMPEDLGERTEQPTARRLSEARGRGQVAKSQELSAAVDLAAGVVLLVLAGGFIARSFFSLMERVYASGASGWSTDPDSLWPIAKEAALDGAVVLFPLLLATGIIAFVAQFMQVGWLLTTKPLMPKLSKINPVSGLQRLFSKRSIIKSAVNSVKLTVVLAVASAIIARWAPQIVGLPALGATEGMILIARMLLLLALWLVAVLLIIGVIDWMYQRWQHTQDLKMTKQQVKDERRSLEGDPQVKGRRFRMMRDILMQQIQHQVPLADVVVTNPTHFAVALRYDPDKMNAPRVVAKGADFMAQRIRLVAAAAGVAIVERPPLARGLYYGVDVGREISAEYYEAVAEILAYVYRLEGQTRESAAPAHQQPGKPDAGQACGRGGEIAEAE